MSFDRRTLLAAGAAAGFASMFGLFPALASGGARPNAPFKLSDAEWRKRLSPLAYQVLREAATERAWTSPLLKEHRKGKFTCAGCDLPLYDSSTKYESGTGWPSFYRPLDKAIGTSSGGTSSSAPPAPRSRARTASAITSPRPPRMSSRRSATVCENRVEARKSAAHPAAGVMRVMAIREMIPAPSKHWQRLKRSAGRRYVEGRNHIFCRSDLG